jgi:hypothetical protein
MPVCCLTLESLLQRAATWRLNWIRALLLVERIARVGHLLHNCLLWLRALRARIKPMDYSYLRLIRDSVLRDLQDVVPPRHYERAPGAYGMDVAPSKTPVELARQRDDLDMSLGFSLRTNHDTGDAVLEPRQRAASDVLFCMGRLGFRSPARELQLDSSDSNSTIAHRTLERQVTAAIKRYLRYLDSNELRPIDGALNDASEDSNSPPRDDPGKDANALSRDHKAVVEDICEVSHSAQGLTTADMAIVFDGLNHWDAGKWVKNSSTSRWTHGARISLGSRGGPPSTWNPLILGQILVGRANTQKARNRLLTALNGRFAKIPVMSPWKADFNEYFSTHFEEE